MARRRKSGYWAIFRHRSGRVDEHSLDELQFKLLTDLAAGATLTEACSELQAEQNPADLLRLAAEIQHWFQAWSHAGWFCAPDARG